MGEALGNSPGDIVNPRDLRDGAFGDPVDVRLQTPMINSKLIFDNFTFQWIYIPQPYFNLLPTPGNDAAFPFAQRLPPTVSLQIVRETSLPLSNSGGGGEFGGRVGALIGSWDFSLFYLSDYDRNPSYVFDASASTANQLVVRETHSRIKNYGWSLTNDFGGYLMRLEAVLTQDRVFPTLVGSTLSIAQRSNFTGALGVDLPTWNGINTSLQLTRETVLGADAPGLLRTGDQSLILIRLARSFFLNHEVEFLETYSTSDQGARTWLNYILPLSNQSELRLGAEVLSGPATSDLGERSQQSRAFVVFRSKLRH